MSIMDIGTSHVYKRKKMGNKKITVRIKGQFIKERLEAIGSSQVELAKYLGRSPRHVNRCIQSNEMAEDLAIKTSNFLDVNIAMVIEHPTNYGMAADILDGMTFSEQYQLSLKQMDSQRKLFYLLMRFCGRSEREILSYSDELLALYMHRVQEFMEDEIIEPHMQSIKENNPKLFDFIMSTSADSIFDKEYETQKIEQEKKEKDTKKHSAKIDNIDIGKLMALSRAGRSDSFLAAEFGVSVDDIKKLKAKLKGGGSFDLK